VISERWGLTPMVKVEVVVAGEDAPSVTEVFKAAGAVGFTTVANVSGFGHHGYHQGLLAFNDRSSLVLLMVVLPEEHVESLLEGLRQIFTERRGVLFVSDTFVSRPEYFR